MKAGAVIFDVYGTLLRVDAAPVDAAARWARLWQHTFGTGVRLSIAEFAAACDRVIAREHAGARAAGIPYPEIFWPEVLSEVLPEIGPCPAAERDDFMYEQAGLWHTVSLMRGAAEALRNLCDQGLLLGLASNAQPYTLHELAAALSTGGLSPGIFEPDLSFWSFAHGFSKPDPHVFRLLTARLRARGVTAGEVVMVGDRVDNDIAPAHAQGWRTWHFADDDGSDWAAFAGFLRRSAA